MPIRGEMMESEGNAEAPLRKTLFTLEPVVIANKRRVAIYCRVSTKHDDQKGSIAAQKEHFMEMISANPGWELTEVFIDHGITGTKREVRPELLRMLKMATKGDFDLILTKSVSRFARNTLDCLNMVRTLRDLGVEIIFEAENLSRD